MLLNREDCLKCICRFPLFSITTIKKPGNLQTRVHMIAVYITSIMKKLCENEHTLRTKKQKKSSNC